MSTVLALKQFINTLSPISESTWGQIEPLFAHSTLKKGGYFIKDGQLATQFAFLGSGVIRGYYQDTFGAEYNKHFFIAPSIVGGYTSLITGQPNRIIQQALTDCVLMQADYTAFISLYDSFPDLERVGRRFAELYFVEKEQKEIELVLLSAEKRYQLFQKRYPGLEQQISQYHIASYLGITPTQLSRIRKKWAQL